MKGIEEAGSVGAVKSYEQPPFFLRTGATGNGFLENWAGWRETWMEEGAKLRRCNVLEIMCRRHRLQRQDGCLGCLGCVVANGSSIPISPVSKLISFPIWLCPAKHSRPANSGFHSGQRRRTTTASLSVVRCPLSMVHCPLSMRTGMTPTADVDAAESRRHAASQRHHANTKTQDSPVHHSTSLRRTRAPSTAVVLLAP